MTSLFSQSIHCRVCFKVFQCEGRTTAAGRFRHGVIYHDKSTPNQLLFIINGGTLYKPKAYLINDQLSSCSLEDSIEETKAMN